MSNLPPGITVGMLPGNSAEELAAEAFAADFDAALAELKVITTFVLSEEAEELLSRWTWDRIRSSYQAGFKDGAAEERYAAESAVSEGD